MSEYREKIGVALMRHARYFNNVAWPKHGSEEWEDLVETWAKAFGEIKASPAKVEKASHVSRRLDPTPSFKQEHLTCLLKIVREIDEADGRSPGQPTAAGVGSPEPTDCDLCGGNGWATIFREGYDGSPVRRINGRSVAMRVATPCLCPKGRWVLERIRETDPDSRLKDLAICMPTGWTLEDPTVSLNHVR